MSKNVLLFLDGEEPNAGHVRQILEDKNFISIIATDGAARFAMQHAIKLDAIVGDMDSLTKDAGDFFRAQGTEIVEIPEQSSNDFEKALRYIASKGDDIRIYVFGIHGKRTDHVFANFSVLLRYSDKFDDIIAYDEVLIHRCLTTKRKVMALDLPTGSIVSLTPLPRAECITTQGLYYPLENETMVYGESEGLSNTTNEPKCSISINGGALLVSYMI